MSEPESVFKGDATKLTGIDIDSQLTTAEAPTCEHFIDPLSKATKESEERSETQKAEVYRFIRIICQFQPSFDTPSQPFVPMFQMEGKRSRIPADLTGSDIEAIRILATQTTNPALNARLSDVLWVLTKDHKAAAQAVQCYITQAKTLATSAHFSCELRSLQRALYLALKLGRGKPLFDSAAETAVAAARRAATSRMPFHCSKLMYLILQYQIGSPTEFAAIASSIATKATAAGDARKAKVYWLAEASWHQLAKNKPEERRARLAAAEAAVMEAESRASGKGSSFMAAASLMGKAIEELRQAGATKERISELRKRMNEWQERSVAEFESFSIGVDVSKLVMGAQDHVKGNDFPTAAHKLAFGQDLSDPRALKDQVIENAKQAPFHYMMGTAIVDHRGRTIARKDSLINVAGDISDTAIENEAFSQASKLDWPLRVQSFIEPARQQILNDHMPSIEDLLFIVRKSPFIPPGHELIFLRGLHAGFHGDFLVATHLLTPQIENSMRHILESRDIDVSILNSNQTQQAKMLGGIFGFPESKQILGEALCFELRGCLIEKAGFDLRNRVAHGFVSEDECYSAAGVTVWWLVLRTCLTPLLGSSSKTS
jgi:hypothetical protein